VPSSGGRARYRAVRGGHGGSRSGKDTFLRHVCAECFGLVIFERAFVLVLWRHTLEELHMGVLRRDERR